MIMAVLTRSTTAPCPIDRRGYAGHHEKFGELARRATMARIGVVDGRERLDRLLDRRKAEHSEPVWQKSTRSRILHDYGPTTREVTKRAIADPSVLLFHAGRLGAAELATRLLNVAPVALRGARELTTVREICAGPI